MTYQVLARKWRPRTFDQLVGQEHVVRALVNALDSDRVHHAMLFTGTRGVGKTTIARIFAKALNCENGVSSHPCGECGACKDIDEGRFFDLIEVDAASRTKVDDTRDLLDNVQYAPSRGRFKVYLIDEVHMLSTHSFNALLKTLEEPPPHVKFLLATTDPQKLPVTILSRCLQFNLKRLANGQITEYLTQLLSEEKVEAETEAIEQIAFSADGSMRDALSLLDQAIAFGGGKLTIADVRSMLGTVESHYLDQLLGALAAGDPQSLWNTCQEMIQYSPDYGRVLGEIAQMLHHAAVRQIVPEVSAKDRTSGAGDRLAESMSAEDVQLCYQIAAAGRADLDLAPDHRTGFEMTLLRMLAFLPGDSQGVAVSGKAHATAAQRSVQPAAQPSAQPTAQPPVQPLSQPAGRPPAQQPVQSAAREPSSPDSRNPPPESPAQNSAVAAKELSADQRASGKVHPQPEVPSDDAPGASGTPIGDDWDSVIRSLGLSGPAAMLAQNSALTREGERQFLLTLDQKQEFLHTPKAENAIRFGLERFYGKGVRLRFQFGPASDTPAEKHALAADARQQAAEAAIARDPNVISLQQQLGAEVIAGSVRPVDDNEGIQ